MKKVIALKGTPNSGKSQTIRTVVELLGGKFPDDTVEHEETARVDGRVLTINDSRIGIESRSDRLLKGSLDRFVTVDCELILCATRTRGATVNTINALRGYEVVWLEQRPETDPIERLFSTLAMAREIAEELENAIATAQPEVLARAAGR